MRRILSTVFLIVILFSITLTIIAFGRGYRPNFGQRTISSTGLLVATSNPDGAQIFLDGVLKSATNTTLALSPGWYTVRIVKEGYLPWEKRIKIIGEVVSETQTLLFPSTPTLAPLTQSGVVAPVVSPDGTKVVFAVPHPSLKAGLWVLNLTSSPLGLSRDSQLISKSTPNLDFSAGTYSWSPDSKRILVTIGANHYLVDADKENAPLPLSLEAEEDLTKKWQAEAKDKEEEKLVLLAPDFIKIATASGKIISFSPDERKVLYQATASANLPPLLANPPIAANPTRQVRDLKPGKSYVYDSKEDKNFEISLPDTGVFLSWFPSSRHLVMAESDKISVWEYDGTNKTVVYSGPFEKFIASSPSGSKLLILTSYNRPGQANLYSINLR